MVGVSEDTLAVVAALLPHFVMLVVLAWGYGFAAAVIRRAALG